MYEKLEECPICGFTSHENYLICDDHSVSKESFALVKCNKCQLIYTNPRPSSETLSSYYESSDYISHTNAANNLVNLAYKTVRHYTLRWKYNIIHKLHKQPGTILDFGCGTGDFLQTMQQRNWQTIGVEPNEQAAQIARDKSLEVYPSLSKQNKSKYDIITAWHVLEHVPDLKDTLRRLRKRLTDSGYILAALPNNASFDAQHYGAHWAGYDVPRHLYHFTPASFQYLINQTQLKLHQIIPMPLDAYYVSILSEKYLHNKQSILKGLNIGRQSNKQAKTNKQYSSLIYVLRK